VVFHEPGYSAGGGYTDSADVKKFIQPILENYGVAAVFSGHNHYYARVVVNGITYFTVGTGGGESYAPSSHHKNVKKTYQGLGSLRIEIQGNTLNGWFIDVDNRMQDHFSIEK
jgi:hypothetical protein